MCVRGKVLLELPYTVKGMDVSFSGILSRVSVLARTLLPTSTPAPTPPSLHGTSIHDLTADDTSQPADTDTDTLTATAKDTATDTDTPDTPTDTDTPADPRVTQDDLCFSLQETLFAMLTETTERALAHTGARDVLLVGGVACNHRLQAMLRAMVGARGDGGAVGGIDGRYCIDNGAMIACAALRRYHAVVAGREGPARAWAVGEGALAACTVTQRYRTDDVWVSWRD